MNDTTYDHLLMIETSYDMAGWEKEGGQWFQLALVCKIITPIPIPLESNSHFTHPLFSSGQNSRTVSRGRWKLHGI